jgi:hypothetical protein
MKGLPATLLALLFAFFSLVSLLMVPRDSDSKIAAVADKPAKVSEIGLRFTFQR